MRESQTVVELSATPLTRQTVLVPDNEQERQAVRDQLERILTSPVFRNSKRYAAVLRFVVERTLEGGEGQLKERIIGVEVFGREADYDTATDHVVRSAVAEVRKRLAQYYLEEKSSREIKIELQPGSYVPQFREATIEVPSADLPQDAPADASSEDRKTYNRWKITKLWWVLCWGLIPIALLTGFAIRYERQRHDSLERFWQPVLSSHGQLLLCVGNVAGAHQNVVDPLEPKPPISLADFHSLDNQTILMDDAVTLARIAGLMQANQRPYHIQSQSRTTFEDLQNGPAVLIGLMNNDWTERLVKNLRFSVERSSPWILTIRDHEHPANNDWSVDYSLPYLQVTKDYALIVRVTDPKTEQMVVTIAGLSVFGTLAAGEFVTNPADMKKLDAIAPGGLNHKNMEIVISTDVIRGETGPPTVVATRFW